MLNSILGSTLTLSGFLICPAVSLVLGLATAGVAMYRSRCTQSFAITAAILPAVVQLVIMLVNGSVGVGVAVAGAFSLVRCRGRRARSACCFSRWPSALPPAWAMSRWRHCFS